MALFPNLHFEHILQVDDRTRLDATQSYVTKDEVALTVVEIEPEAGAGFISVFASNNKNWYLDYQYATDGNKVVTVRVDNGSGPVTASFNIQVLSAVDDYLFSDDGDIIRHESDILRYTQEGRNSFLNMHRRSQQMIMAFLDEKGITDNEGAKLDKLDVVDVSEVKEWSTALTLSLIFQDLSNDVEDVFANKSNFYKSLAMTHRDRSYLRLDRNNDSVITVGEGANFSTMDLIRR